MSTRTPKYLLKIRIDGPGIRRGSVPLPELIRVCRIAQDAVNRQAEAMRGKKALTPGPKQGVVKEECTLELFGKIGEGSSILPLRLAKDSLALPGMKTIGIEAVHDVGTILKQFSNGHKSSDIDAPMGVLASLKELGEVVGGPKIDYVEWIVPKFNGTPALKAKFNVASAEKVRERMKQPVFRHESAEGILEMVDFKPQDRKCRIKPPLGQPVLCTFRPEDEAKVLSYVKCPVRIAGTAKANPHSGKTEEIAIEKIEPIEAMMIGAGDFFANKSLAVLARQQGVSPISDPMVLSGGLSEDEDVDAFLEVIYQSRA